MIFLRNHCLFLLFVMIICMLGHEYINGIELEGIFKILLEDKLENKHNKKIFYIFIVSLISSICLIIKDYNKQGY
jgi:hypothetical protein